jgi:hypothetical protein
MAGTDWPAARPPFGWQLCCIGNRLGGVASNAGWRVLCSLASAVWNHMHPGRYRGQDHVCAVSCSGGCRGAGQTSCSQLPPCTPPPTNPLASAWSSIDQQGTRQP